MLYSIIIATYNSEQTIAETIESIKNQTYNRYELIIIDGGSKDKTTEILKSYNIFIDYWISERDKGIYDAWNKGLKQAKGDWVCFVGGDDILMPDMLESYNNYILNYSYLDFVSSKVELVTEDKRSIRIVGKPWSWNKFKKYMTTIHVGAMHNFHYFSYYGNFNDFYSIAADYELLLRAKNKLKAGFLNKVTVQMRVGGVSESIKAILETFKAQKEHNVQSHILLRRQLFIAIFKFFSRKTFQFFGLYSKVLKLINK